MHLKADCSLAILIRYLSPLVFGFSSEQWADAMGSTSGPTETEARGSTHEALGRQQSLSPPWHMVLATWCFWSDDCRSTGNFEKPEAKLSGPGLRTDAKGWRDGSVVKG